MITIEEYKVIQWYFHLLIFPLEFLVLIKVFQVRKHLSPVLFDFFVLTCANWLFDTLLVVIKYDAPQLLKTVLFNLYVFVFQFWFTAILLYEIVFKKQKKKVFLVAILLHTIISGFIVLDNILKNQPLGSNVMIINLIIIIALSVFALFQSSEDDIKYVWGLSPSFIINSAILIDFLSNSVLFFSGQLLYKYYPDVLWMLSILRLFIWILYCSLVSIGLHQLTRKPTIKSKSDL